MNAIEAHLGRRTPSLQRTWLAVISAATFVAVLVVWLSQFTDSGIILNGMTEIYRLETTRPYVGLIPYRGGIGFHLCVPTKRPRAYLSPEEDMQAILDRHSLGVAGFWYLGRWPMYLDSADGIFGSHLQIYQYAYQIIIPLWFLLLLTAVLPASEVLRWRRRRMATARGFDVR